MSSPIPTVYVINKSLHDFSAAKLYGNIVYLSTGPVNRYATNKICRKFLSLLKDSKREDFLLVTSLTIMNMLAASIMVSKHKCLNLLIHRSEDNSYVERRMDFTDI